MAENISVIYWDSSVILSALFTDEHSEAAKKWTNKEGVHFLSTLAYAEISAVISRMQKGKR